MDEVAVPILPPRDPLDAEPITTTIRLGKKLRATLETIARQKGYSMNEVVVAYLKWALKQDLVEEEGSKK